MKKYSAIMWTRLRQCVVLFALLCAGVFSTSSFATEPVSLKSEADFYLALTKNLSAFVDPSGDMQIADVIDQPELFSPVTTKYPDFGLTAGRVWLRMSFVNETGTPNTWRLDINRQYYSEMDIILAKPNAPLEQLLRSTNENSFNDRTIPNRMLATDFVLTPDDGVVDFYIGYRSDSTTYLPLGVGTIEAANKKLSQENTFNWILNGALLAIILFTLMMTPVIGWRLSVSFALYILAGFIFVYHADGYTFKYIWPDAPMVVNDPANLSFMVLMPVFGLTFSRAMFNFKKNAPLLDKYIKVFIVVAVLTSLCSALIYQNQTLKVLAYLIPPLGSLSQIAAGTIAIRRKLLGAVPYFIGSLIVVSSFIYALVAHAFPGQFNLDYTLDYGHFSLLVECFAFAAAIVIRLSGLRNERDLALQAELKATHEKLALSSELKQSQENYIQAQKMSSLRRNQLSSVSHDLQQPLASLRTALSRIGGTDEDAIQQMYSAFDYLEKLARDQINAGKTGTVTAHLEGSLETFSARTILDNVYEMFKDEADAKNLKFTYSPVDVDITSDPIALMRAVSNLVSNAIKHTETGHIKLTGAARDDRVRIDVSDSGNGMSEAEITRLSQQHEKGEKSQGSGLGLTIVQEISDALSLDFKLDSKVGVGSKASLSVPISAS